MKRKREPAEIAACCAMEVGKMQVCRNGQLLGIKRYQRVEEEKSRN